MINTLVLSLILCVSQTNSSDQILGTWLSSDREVKIQIYKRSGKYFGKIVWFKKGKDTGKFSLDVKNPDPALRKREILGLEILKGFQYDAKSAKWKNGSIYHPQHGKTFRGAMWLTNARTLQIRGYWGLLHRTNTWTKLP